MTDPTRARSFGVQSLAVIAVLAAVAAVGIAALLTNIFERKTEARNPFYRVVELTDSIDDPEVWGKNFPIQYDAYLRTVDQVRTRYGGSEALPQAPSNADPRSIVAQSRLEEDPRLRRFWAGYAFATDFREERGHAYMLSDQEFTQRQAVTQQPGTCINCHASTYTAYQRAGNGDPHAGFAALNAMSYADARAQVKHPVSCIDCHDPSTMQLRVTRPAFMEGIRRAKAVEGRQNFDVNRDATRQEMRTYVCGQCHVEYYFRGAEKRLTYPWSRGLLVDSMLAYYDSVGHRDWCTPCVASPPELPAGSPSSAPSPRWPARRSWRSSPGGCDGPITSRPRPSSAVSPVRSRTRSQAPPSRSDGGASGAVPRRSSGCIDAASRRGARGGSQGSTTTR